MVDGAAQSSQTDFLGRSALTLPRFVPVRGSRSETDIMLAVLTVLTALASPANCIGCSRTIVKRSHRLAKRAVGTPGSMHRRAVPSSET